MEKYLAAIMAFYFLYIVFLSYLMLRARVGGIKSQAIKYNYFKAYTGFLPDHIAVVSNHFNNQFQIPVMFMLACLLQMQLNCVNWLSVALAVGFVLSRLLHSYVHLGKNRPVTRAKVYFLGMMLVAALFIQATLNS